MIFLSLLGSVCFITTGGQWGKAGTPFEQRKRALTTLLDDKVAVVSPQSGPREGNDGGVQGAAGPSWPADRWP